MKKGLTELVFILDRSGSMEGLERDTIGGFNAMLEKQRRQEGECIVSTVLFDSTSQMLHDRVPLPDVPPMTEDDYCVRGCTALLDALGSTMQHISNIHKYIRKEDVPEHTIFVITTDGMENASRKYRAGQVRTAVKRYQKEKGWEFLFLGANIDAVSTAGTFGISEDRSVSFTNDSQGIATNYKAISEAIDCFRANRKPDRSWKRSIEKDHGSR